MTKIAFAFAVTALLAACSKNEPEATAPAAPVVEAAPAAPAASAPASAASAQ